MVKRLTALAIVLVCVSVAAVVSNAVAGTANAGPEKLSWEDCSHDVPADTDIRCADLSVPVDWQRPDGERTTVGLAKIPAENPDQRIGSLLVNTGGPGPMVEELPDNRLTELTNWFDVIAFDPRGMGVSSGITCPRRGPHLSKLMFSLGSEAWRTFARDNRKWAAGCWRAAGPLAGNLDAWQVAHDMEAIRAALGEGGLTYYGNSYGTVYGQTYAELFPTKVHRMYLDSVADHTERSSVKAATPMATVIRNMFDRFVEWCGTDTSCALHPDNGYDVWDELMAKARQHPLPAPGAGSGKTVGPSQLRIATLNYVLDPASWSAFAKALAEARAGDAGGLYVPPPPRLASRLVSYVAWCSDFPYRRGSEAMAQIERRLREKAPRVGWLMARFYYARCAGQAHQGTFPPSPLDPGDGLPPVLLVNGLRDPATPPGAGRAVADQLPGSVWIGADAGHAVYLYGNRCVRDIVHRYLRTGDLPADERTCPA